MNGSVVKAHSFRWVYKAQPKWMIRPNTHNPSNPSLPSLNIPLAMLFSSYCFISTPLLPFLLVTVAFLAFHSVSGTGLPMQKMECCQQMSCCAAAPMQCMPSCGGCGRRRRREAVQPLISGKETPCPQTEWQRLMENAIVPLDDVRSVDSVQKALRRRFPRNKFLVMCALAPEGPKGRTEGAQMLPNECHRIRFCQVHLSSSGHGYCNVISERIWCQAAAVVV